MATNNFLIKSDCDAYRRKRKQLNLLIKMCWITIGLILFFKVLASNINLYVDTQKEKCLPYTYYLFIKGVSEYKSGSIYSFESKNIPFFKDGSRLGKILLAKEGDLITINKDGLFVNEHLITKDTLVHAKKLNKEVSSFYTSYTIPKGKLFMYGTAPNSFDSRYYGLIDSKSLTGRLIPLW
ncbi:signal peptidase I [Photobacterium damselae subsp. damselae]|uniref:Signal peptidase I n=1 Tax=Photobacterium damselae subsp. damselae TaxID=85581 RepID=A0A850QVM6_PHODD|nr:signal peptidase I [Photobacterium damselae subsp. damselae]